MVLTLEERWAAAHANGTPELPWLAELVSQQTTNDDLYNRVSSLIISALTHLEKKDVDKAIFYAKRDLGECRALLDC